MTDFIEGLDFFQSNGIGEGSFVVKGDKLLFREAFCMIVKIAGHALGWVIFYFVFFVKFMEFISIVAPLFFV